MTAGTGMPAPRRSARWWALLGLAAVIAAAAWLGAPVLLGPAVPAYRVARQDIVQTVVASGRVETPYRVEIGSQITGTVTEIPVREGQFVRAGDTLIVLEDHEARAAVVQAEGAVAQAEARIRQMRELSLPAAEQALRQAQANLTNMRQIFQRTATLNREGHTTRAQLDDAQKNLDVAETQVRSAELQVQTNRPGGSDHVLAVAQLEQARANLRTAQARLDYTRIEAPAHGTLIARNVERGSVVQPGRALMVLSPTGETQLVLQIDERNLGVLAIGQRALASAEAYPDQTFSAELVYINPAVDPQRGSVQVKLRVPTPPGYLRQDMTVSVDIEVARRSAALIVPAAAVRDSAGPRPFVFRIADGRIERREVRLGARGNGRVEIAAGIEDGDIVVAAANPALAEGQRVRAAVP